MLWLALLTISHRAFAQDVQPATAQKDTWNSTFTLDDDQISRAGLDNVTAENVNIAARFEQTNWAGSSAGNDTFYIPPANSSTLPPGSLLSIEHYTNTTFYTLPPNTAMSRILFQSETANGTAVPASAYVLWPWMPRTDPETGRLAVVGWAHGTSGTFGECAPSHIRNLWYQYSAPYVLALQGYVVVAPDYAGLGVTHNAHGAKIKHAWSTAAASANDLFHSVKAAQDAFPELSSRFVLMGHSQGGQAAWAAAERQTKRPVDGHIGTIAGSPVTDVESQLQLLPALVALVAPLIAAGLDSVLPEYSAADFLTETGLRRFELFEALQACNNVGTALLGEPGLVRDNLLNTSAFQAYKQLARVGGQPVAGPLLVLHGSADSLVPAELSTQAVNETCTKHPDSQLEYVLLNGTDHVATLDAGQRIWLDWIAERFANKEIACGCVSRNYSSFRPQDTYQANGNYYLEYATQRYQIA